MNHRVITAAIATAAFLITAHALAAEPKLAGAGLPIAAASESSKSTPESKKAIADRRKAAAKVKLVDINSAKLAELKTLPGIGDAEAKKIIAGRPYGSKSWLATHNIIGSGIYEGLKARIVAKQPFKDINKNAALYRKNK